MAWIEISRDTYTTVWGTTPQINLTWTLIAYRDDETNHLKVQSIRQADYVSGTYGYYILSGTWVIDDSYLTSQYIKENSPDTWTSLSASDEWEIGEYTESTILGAASFQTNSTGRDTVHARLTISTPLLDLESGGAIVSGNAMRGIQLSANNNSVYPVPAFPPGYIYISYDNTSPAIMFGGIWEQITDKFLLASGSTYTLGSTGGSEIVTLTTETMPSHRHSAWGLTGSVNTEASYLLVIAKYTSLWSTTSNSVGGDEAHNNMPPYVTVYMWEKISD